MIACEVAFVAERKTFLQVVVDTRPYTMLREEATWQSFSICYTAVSSATCVIP